MRATTEDFVCARYDDMEPVASIQKQTSIIPKAGSGRSLPSFPSFALRTVFLFPVELEVTKIGTEGGGGLEAIAPNIEGGEKNEGEGAGALPKTGRLATAGRTGSVLTPGLADLVGLKCLGTLSGPLHLRSFVYFEYLTLHIASYYLASSIVLSIDLVRVIFLVFRAPDLLLVLTLPLLTIFLGFAVLFAIYLLYTVERIDRIKTNGL